VREPDVAQQALGGRSQRIGELAQVAADLLAVLQDLACRGARLGEQPAGRRGRVVAGLERMRGGLVAQLACFARGLGTQLRGLAAGLGSDLQRLVVGGLDAQLGGPVRLGDPVGGASASLRSSSAARSAAATISATLIAAEVRSFEERVVGEGSSLILDRW
jgi:hypothetical protein